MAGYGGFEASWVPVSWVWLWVQRLTVGLPSELGMAGVQKATVWLPSELGMAGSEADSWVPVSWVWRVQR
ncbi:hypothetical protein DPMN_010335 [Dreissena polymorpha]|uniref:Uncharacterized protein n=1 Tax=Dreissena polymorpha TaxID=45954 RepID=A0A9D4N252_DREPO|nr:hypothetical protein DPMN_010335 [Dreissena polymorpha]